jgi:hypothetical protein
MEIGYSVLTAGNTEEAVEIFRRHKETISLAVLDAVMPRMSGKAAEIGISFFPGMVGRRGEALGTYTDVVFRGLDQPFRHATPPTAASGGLSPSVFPPWDGSHPETRTYVGCREEGVDGGSPAPFS